MKTVTGISDVPRRHHERWFKADLVAQCLVPGASVAAIALAGGINANLLFKWRRIHLGSMRPGDSPSSSTVLVPVHVAPAPVAVGQADGDAQPVALPPASPATVSAPPRVARSTGVVGDRDRRWRLPGLQRLEWSKEHYNDQNDEAFGGVARRNERRSL